MTKLEYWLAKVRQMQDAAQSELLRMHPPGSEIQFTIKHGQRNASTGTVWSAGFRDGYLRVKHHEAKEGSRYAFRDVHYSDVLK
ncbi:MAG: hypothetical protein RLZZ524_2346 [Pseudomonadota bacterium]|jgi:hypothetical protein